MKQKNKKFYFTTNAKYVGLFSKIVIIILVFGLIISHINFVSFAIFARPNNNVELTEDVNRDLSLIKRVEEIEELRTLDSKTYLKENGMFETDVYDERIHYLKNGSFIDIDNTLELINNKYVNKDNAYNLILPEILSKEKEVSLKYLDKEIKIYYDLDTPVVASLSSNVLRNKTNLKDELFYYISDKEKLQYILKQNSIKENVILSSYIENYTYSYYINTPLRLERIGNEIHFIDGTQEIFVMDEYYMYDTSNNDSYNIDFSISVIDNDTYKITVKPDDTFLKTALYPVVIDPEITLIDGGIIAGITSLYSIDKKTNTNTFLTLGNFTLANRNSLNNSDDLIACLNVYIPREYKNSIVDIITQNQLMYANITLTTIETNATSDTKVKMKYDGNIIDEVTFHNSNVFNHRFNIIDALNENIDSFATNDIDMSFELYVDGVSNTEVTYSLGWDLGGEKPLITLGYLDDAGLADYYTYESFPLDNESSIYLAHNSGNLTYIFNDYTDNILLNLSHIYNANRKNNNSIYGSGFNLSYNEEISISYSNIILTLGNGRKVTFNPTNTTKTKFIATDGTGAELIKVFNSNNELIAYEINIDGGVKVYNSSGKLIKIYIDESERIDGAWNNDAKSITLTYNANDTLKQVIDSYGNKIEFTYLTIANDPTESQVGIPYLAYLEVFKKDNEGSIINVRRVEFEYIHGNLIAISNYKGTTSAEYTYFNYNSKNHIERIYKNNNGYDFIYDNKNRVTRAKVYSSSFSNGNYIDFAYSKNGKKTIITDGAGHKTSYTFDSYYHTDSIEDANGYTTFYKYEDIFFDTNGSVVTSPNYKKNHTIKVQSNNFKNTINPIVNHGFEVVTSENIYGWSKNVTNGSTAKIETNSYLYGSRVLELYKSASGTSSVYQEIDVENGKEYIVSGYIKNVNNNGTGSYIDILGINGEVTTLSKSSNIKNSKDFCRFEYKFKAEFTGKVKIALVNNSVGYAYFDNIQVNTNYVDTRYNYLENSSFENTVIGGWSGYNYIVVSKDNNMFSDNCGTKSLKLAIGGTISQTIDVPGLKGDTFVFGGYSLYENYTGNVTVKITLIKQNGVEQNSFTFKDSDINASYMMARITATENYQSIKIEISNNSLSSYAYLDNFSVYKEGYGINITYNDNGDIEEEYNEITYETSLYEYDNDGRLVKIEKTTSSSTNNGKTDTTNITYNNNGNLSSIENKNITSTYTTDNDGNITKIETEAEGNEIKYYQGSTTYTPDGLYPKEEKDVFGNITTSTYNYITGLLEKVIDSEQVYKEYEYDKNGNVIKLINGKGTNKKTVTYTYDTFGNITSITSDGLTYTFTYNSHNDIKTISVGGETLVVNNYQNENSSNEIYTGNIDNTVYSYGIVYFEYDEEGRIKSISQKSNNSELTKVLEYTYNDYSEIASYTDYKEEVTYYYNYDYQNRLININATNGNTITYEYDDNSRLVNKTNINGSNTYGYGNVSITDEENEQLISENISNKFNINYTYSNDSFSQLETISFYITANSIDKNYTYETTVLDGVTYYTGRIKQIEYKNGTNSLIKYIYTYDKNNNITNIIGYENNVLVYQEENSYDFLNQLVMQYVLANGKEIGSEYLYDSRGNILSYYVLDVVTNKSLYSYNFTYQQTGNKDKLCKVESLTDGKEYYIEYSTNKEPSIYFGWTIGYDMKSITTLINNEYEINYTYNANGIRTTKEVTNNNNTTSTEYILDGTNIIKEIRSGESNATIQYFYDSNNEVIGFTYNNEKYLYLKNIQKDVIGIIDSNNNIVVKYYYNGYGRIINKVDTSGINLSEINPFRYRSYYQDNETKWYYLNSRYYDTTTCRFITMDDVDYLGASGSVLSYNLYSYCENNPIINIDPNGYKKVKMSPTETLIIGIIGLIVNLLKYGTNILKIFKVKDVETIVKIIMSFFVYLPVALANEIVVYYIKNIASAICSFTSTILYKMVSLGLNISKISLGGLVISTVIFIALRFLPKLYDSVSMIVFGINGKSYFINRKWYGFTYYNK